ncbi:protein of unknown function [[Clostridium] ultunense Esp]|uniref:Transposase DDE domain-containing protein n=1 Tax=[Clostridium] ultunense Esp TaxID=1288971 RepID=A0A1M4PJA7_9FIRM|nr:protein of unknown function [[Clostridium] ultunense Esp]
MEEVEHLRHTSINKEIYDMRKETIERVFADMKEKHGMRWTTLRGLKKVKAQAMLIAACMNLKKIANWMWRSRKNGPNPSNPCVNMHGLLSNLYSFIICSLRNTVSIKKETVFCLLQTEGTLYIESSLLFSWWINSFLILTCSSYSASDILSVLFKLSNNSKKSAHSSYNSFSTLSTTPPHILYTYLN